MTEIYCTVWLQYSYDMVFTPGYMKNNSITIMLVYKWPWHFYGTMQEMQEKELWVPKHVVPTLNTTYDNLTFKKRELLEHYLALQKRLWFQKVI